MFLVLVPESLVPAVVHGSRLTGPRSTAHLLWHLVLHVPRAVRRILAWSHWYRHHQ